MASPAPRTETVAVYVETRIESYVRDPRRDPFKRYEFTQERVCRKDDSPIDASTMDEEIATLKANLLHVKKFEEPISQDMTRCTAPKTGTHYKNIDKITYIVTRIIKNQS